jgi:hypothetical protein
VRGLSVPFLQLATLDVLEYLCTHQGISSEAVASASSSSSSADADADEKDKKNGERKRKKTPLFASELNQVVGVDEYSMVHHPQLDQMITRAINHHKTLPNLEQLARDYSMRSAEYAQALKKTKK